MGDIRVGSADGRQARPVAEHAVEIKLRTAAIAQGDQVGGSVGGRCLHRAIALDHIVPEGRQARAFAAAAALLTQDQRVSEAAVETIDQQPGAALGHTHGPLRGGDRAGLGDQLQQPHFPWPEPGLRRDVDTQMQVGRGMPAVRRRRPTPAGIDRPPRG